MLAAGAALAPLAWAAQPAPPKLIKIVVPFASGGSNDVIARAIAVPLARSLDATVIVENRPGAAGVIGSDMVAKSPKDGSVLLLTSSSLLTAAATQPQLPFDPIVALAPVAVVGRGPMLLAVPGDAAYKTPADVIAAARAKPGAMNYGTAGVGSIAHLATELFDDVARIKLTHVPYKGAAPAAVDLAAGRIDVMISNYSTLAPLIKGGKIRPLAVTSGKPQAAFPGLPPLSGVAPGFDVDIWVGVFVPAGTPASVVDMLNREIVTAAASPELAPVLEPDGALPEAIGASAFAARLKDELAQWKRIAAEHKITAE
jgi:tripartite-type tricarboxylate transporter receptor subunit TctC